MTARAAIAAFLLAAAGGPPPATLPAEEWRLATEPRAWSFPADHWSHPGYRTEWWYLTGHLAAASDPDRRFGFQLTFFRIGLAPDPPAGDSAWAASDLILGHAAIVDLGRGDHRFSELRYRAVPLLGGFNRYPVAAIAWSRGPAGTDAPWTLHWNGAGFDLAGRDDRAGFGFQLSARPLRPPVLQGEDGLSRKGDRPGSGASHYYSFTRLATEGTVTVDGEPVPVRGLAWMDREFGSSQLREDQVGWDWFSLQLDDGRDLMLYQVRDRDGGGYASGTRVAADGTPRTLGAGDFALRATGAWRSPATGIEYPSGWTIDLPGEGLRLRVEPEVAGQENRAELGVTYWEGAVRVLDGDALPAGQGYVELTGYGEGNRPAI